MKLLDLYRPVRRYSYLLTSVGIVSGVAYLVLKSSPSPLGVAAFILVAGVLWGLQRWLRPGKQRLGSAAEVLNLIGRGRPTFVNFYSNL